MPIRIATLDRPAREGARRVLLHEHDRTDTPNGALGYATPNPLGGWTFHPLPGGPQHFGPAAAGAYHTLEALHHVVAHAYQATTGGRVAA